MKLKRTNPCNECPFRKAAAPGWLGPWNQDTILQQAHSESGLACHVDGLIKKKLPDLELHDKVHVCVGGLMNANASCKSFRNPELREFAKKVGTSPDILTAWEFKEHHSRLDRMLQAPKKKKVRR